MKRIPLTQGKHAIVDNEHFLWLMQWKWFYSGGYAVRNVYSRENGKKKLKTILMHRLINKTPAGIFTDHKDGKTLNNTKDNLRNCTYRQNHMNRTKFSGTSQYKGVRRNKRKSGDTYTSAIGPNEKRVIIGTFKSEIKAAKAYDKEARKLYGRFAKLNFK